MKLIFNKNAEGAMEVKIMDKKNIKEFSYVEMIKLLRENNKFEESDFGENITEDEKKRIKTMLLEINTAIAKTNKKE